MEPGSADEVQQKHNGTEFEIPARPSRPFTLRSDHKIRRNAEHESLVKHEEQPRTDLERRSKTNGSKSLTRMRCTTKARSSGIEQGALPTSSVSTQPVVVVDVPKAAPMDSSSTVKNSRATIYLGRASDHSLAQRENCRLRSSVSGSDESNASRQAPLSHTVSSYWLWYLAVFNQLGLGLQGQVRPLLQCLIFLLNGTIQIGYHLCLLVLWIVSNPNIAVFLILCQEVCTIWLPIYPYVVAIHTTFSTLDLALSTIFTTYDYWLSSTIGGTWLFSTIPTMIKSTSTASGSWLSSTVSTLVGSGGASIQHLSSVVTYSMCFVPLLYHLCNATTKPLPYKDRPVSAMARAAAIDFATVAERNARLRLISFNLEMGEIEIEALEMTLKVAQFAQFQRLHVQKLEGFSTRASGLLSHSLGDYVSHSSASIDIVTSVTGNLKNRLERAESERLDVSYYIEERSYELLGNYSPLYSAKQKAIRAFLLWVDTFEDQVNLQLVESQQVLNLWNELETRMREIRLSLSHNQEAHRITKAEKSSWLDLDYLLGRNSHAFRSMDNQFKGVEANYGHIIRPARE